MKLIVSAEESRRLTEVVMGKPGDVVQRLKEDGCETRALTDADLAGGRVSALVADGLLAEAFGPVVIPIEVEP